MALGSTLRPNSNARHKVPERFLFVWPCHVGLCRKKQVAVQPAEIPKNVVEEKGDVAHGHDARSKNAPVEEVVVAGAARQKAEACTRAVGDNDPTCTHHWEQPRGLRPADDRMQRAQEQQQALFNHEHEPHLCPKIQRQRRRVGQLHVCPHDHDEPQRGEL